ncbi:hypothetical protein NLX83_10130 [Allokutzneria sp. A3M-2-11 16]|uniref:hypothetical protein n=1 Tax=Allokutzneria sp. A3M-2-11 16 TaxID=2962043 RepID=UPI0020B71B1A|nr:hypothetical protein [Allokutzneria sp. A3M-2-11 16]MCP3799613.1 hypothetical protein [Allokutzneria sp. A3M-2-11 16]
MSLDQELRRLFDDERLELPVRPDAEHAVLRGAKRRRTRRRALAAGGAAVAVVAALAGGIVLTDLGRTASAPPATDRSDPVPTPAPGRIDTVPHDVIGPHGLGRLSLGMTEADAVATGLIKANSKEKSEDGCRGYNYADETVRHGYYSLLFSDKHGLVRLEARRGTKTPEGIRIGSSVRDVERVYTASKMWHGAVGERITDVPGNPDANYWLIVRDDVLTEVRLELKEQDCYR